MSSVAFKRTPSLVNKTNALDALNPSHPIAAQVTDLYSFKSLQNALVHTPVELINGCAFTGKSIVSDGVNDYAIATLSDNMPTGSDLRWYAGVVTLGEFSTGTASIIWAHGDGGTSASAIVLFAEDNALSVGFIGHRIITPKSALSVGQKVNIFLQNTGTTSGSVDVYIDGVKQTLTNEGGGSLTLTTASQFQFFDDYSGGDNYGKHEIDFFVCGKGNLSDSQISLLAKNPYQILKPRRKFWVAPSASDTTAPVLSSPTGTKTGSTTASGSVSTDEANGTLYYLASGNATETAATIKTGSSQAVTATGVQNVSFTGLTPSTLYYAHYVHDDAASNESNAQSSASFTTDATSSVIAIFRRRIEGQGNAFR